ncbi:unnamed protein product, partial [Rotaria socialis]
MTVHPHRQRRWLALQPQALQSQPPPQRRHARQPRQRLPQVPPTHPT